MLQKKNEGKLEPYHMISEAYKSKPPNHLGALLPG